MTLTEFLLARIAEDESHMGHMRAHLPDYTFPARPLADSYSRRVLAECEAKRRIVSHLGGDRKGVGDPAHPILRHLALPYADDLDYEEAWRP